MTIHTTTIAIDGMTCDGCVKSVNNALKQIKGANTITVSLADKNAVIDYDDTFTDVAALKQAIEDAGYDVIN